MVCKHTSINKHTQRAGIEGAYLGNAEVREDDAARARRAPDEEHLGLEAGVARARVDEVGRRVANAKVPEPVARDGERHRLRTDVEREDLADDDPGDGAPRARERSNVDADERDERLLAGRVRDRDGDADDRDEVLADAHHDRAPDEQRATAKALDTPHAGDGHEHVDDVGRDLRQEGVLDAGVGEERGAVCGDPSAPAARRKPCATYSRR